MRNLRRRWAPVLLVALALAAAGWAAAGGTGLSGGTRAPAGQEAPSEQPAPTLDAPTPAPTGEQEPGELADSEVPGWLSGALTGLFLAIVATVVGVFIYAGVRYLLFERVERRAILDQPASQPPDAAADLAEVLQAVRAGLADMDAGGDPRRAVIACWLRLERLAAAAGTARLAADTPTDLVRRLLARHRVSEPALGRLADAYRRARYAPAEVADDLLETARRALHDVDRQLSPSPGEVLRR
jgi:hypothetical protein